MQTSLRTTTVVSFLILNAEAFNVTPGRKPFATNSATTTAVRALDPELINLSAVPDLNSVDQNTVLGGLGAAVASVVGFFTSRGGKKGESTAITEPEPEPEPIDVSIPYDAAATLAYEDWRKTYNKGDYSAAGYNAFKSLYEEATVAKVTYKKMARDLATFKAECESIEKKLEGLSNENVDELGYFVAELSEAKPIRHAFFGTTEIHQRY